MQGKTEGDRPGLSQSLASDRDQLPAQEAREWEQVVAAVRFFTVPIGAQAQYREEQSVLHRTAPARAAEESPRAAALFLWR